MRQQYQGFLPRQDFQTLLDALKGAGYLCVGPQYMDHAIRFSPVEKVTELAQGYIDEQQPGSYRLTHVTAQSDSQGRYFSFTHTDQGLKPWVFPAREYLWQAQRNNDGGIKFQTIEAVNGAVAYLGARACDLAALQLMDQHFMRDGAVDEAYARRRQSLLLIGVNCQRSAATCFCASTGDGPVITSGYDILLDELDDGFIVSSASTSGRAICDKLNLHAVTQAQIDTAVRLVTHAVRQQQRTLPIDIEHTLKSNPESSHWNDVAARCLSCGNCTMVCPSCFCHAEHDEAALNGQSSQHYRQWDSCFTQGHSYIHGITIRSGTRERYRQWLTHKLAYWHDQYGRSGCVGCGRCISWCPVGIDITAECASLTAADTGSSV